MVRFGCNAHPEGEVDKDILSFALLNTTCHRLLEEFLIGQVSRSLLTII